MDWGRKRSGERKLSYREILFNSSIFYNGFMCRRELKVRQKERFLSNFHCPRISLAPTRWYYYLFKKQVAHRLKHTAGNYFRFESERNVSKGNQSPDNGRSLRLAQQWGFCVHSFKEYNTWTNAASEILEKLSQKLGNSPQIFTKGLVSVIKVSVPWTELKVHLRFVCATHWLSKERTAFIIDDVESSKISLHMIMPKTTKKFIPSNKPFLHCIKCLTSSHRPGGWIL